MHNSNDKKLCGIWSPLADSKFLHHIMILFIIALSNAENAFFEEKIEIRFHSAS